MSQDQGASAKADRAATPSEPSQSSVVSGTAGIPCAETGNYVARPSVIEGVAVACYNDPDARQIAGKESLVAFDDADPDTQEFWRDIAMTALCASGHFQMLHALQQFVNGVETGMIDSPADETLANITQRAKAALAKGRGQ